MASKPTKTGTATTTAKSKGGMKNLSTTNYIAIVSIVCVLVVIVCGVIGKSLVSSLIVNTKAVSDQVKAKQQLDTKLSNIPTLISNYDALGYKQKMIADGLPNTPDFPQIVSTMQAITAASGAQLKSVAPTSASGAAAATTVAPAAGSAAPNGAQPYQFTVTINGQYQQIVGFFRNLELSVRPYTVQDLQMTGDSSNLTVTLTLQTYYQPPADINDKQEVVK